MDAKATLTSKGQITIPIAIRLALGLDAGTQLAFELGDGEVKVRPVHGKTWSDLWRVGQGAKGSAKPIDIDAAIQAAVRERAGL